VTGGLSTYQNPVVRIFFIEYVANHIPNNKPYAEMVTYTLLLNKLFKFVVKPF